jgi:hypothetical protein
MSEQFEFRALLVKVQNLLWDIDRNRLDFLLASEEPKNLRDDPSVSGSLRMLVSLLEKTIISRQGCDYLISEVKAINCNDVAKRLQLARFVDPL